MREPLIGEHWSGRKPASGRRSVVKRSRPLSPPSSSLRRQERPLEFIDWYPPGAEEKRQRKRWPLYFLPSAFIVVFLAAFFVLMKKEKGRETPAPPPKVEAPREVPPPPPQMSQEDLYSQTWYLLTKAAEADGLRVRSTFETEEKVERELQTMGPPEGGAIPFDHERFFYFSITLEATQGSLSPGFVVQAPSRFTLMDEQGNRVQATMPPELEKHAIILEADEGIVEASFYLAFPKERFSASPGSLTLEAPSLKPGEKLAFTWELPIPYPEEVRE